MSLGPQGGRFMLNNSDERLKTELYEYLKQLDNEYHKVFSRIMPKISQFYIGAMKDLCRVHLDDEMVAASSVKQKLQEERSSTANHYSWWSSALMTCYTFSLFHLTLILYHQYSLDIDRHRLSRYASLDPGLSTRRQKDLMQELNETISSKRHLLELLGAPSRHPSFMVESIYVVLIVTTSMTYLFPQACERFRITFDQYIIRSFTNYKREIIKCNNLIGRQVEEFINSSRNHARMIISNLNAAHRSRRRGDVRTYLEVEEDLNFELYLEDRLLRMHATNRLLPLNRRPGWILNLTTMVFILIAYGWFYSTTFDGLILHTLFLSPAFESPRALGLAELLVVVEVIVQLVALNLSINLFGSLSMLTCFDQAMLVSQLSSLMNDCITNNEAQLQRLFDSNDTNHQPHRQQQQQQRQQQLKPLIESYRNKMNCDILFLLMHYKIFAKQLSALKSLLGITLIICIVVTSVLPIINYMHTPYLDQNVGPEARGFLANMSMLYAIPSALCLFPICNMQSRCLDLFRSLTRLVGHIIYVHSQRDFGHFYDDHLFSLLRREVINSPRLGNEFAIVFCGLSFEYSTIMRFYFWLGIFTIRLVR